MSEIRTAADGSELQSIKVWDLPTRVFHWLSVVSFAGAYLTAESERYRDVHVMFGYTLAGLLCFRLLWGMLGTRYARFDSFLYSPIRLIGYLESLLSSAPQRYVGHNPAGALAIFLLLGLGLLVSGSGVACYDDLGGDWLAELHGNVAAAMLALVAVHVVGVVVSSLLHRENLALAMLSGTKSGTGDEGIATSHRGLGVLLALLAFAFWILDRQGWILV